MWNESNVDINEYAQYSVAKNGNWKNWLNEEKIGVVALLNLPKGRAPKEEQKELKCLSVRN